MVQLLTFHPGYRGHAIELIVAQTRRSGRTFAGASRCAFSKTSTSIRAARSGRIAPTTRPKIPRPGTDCQWEERMATIAFTVNGKAVSVEAEPDTPLLWVVREHLKL